MKTQIIKIIGGGLAGTEAAYQLLKRGYEVHMYEMRPVKSTPCHKTQNLAELVCSNSLKSTLEDTASGLLKQELLMLDSLLLRVAYETNVEAGGALAVNREEFSKKIENKLSSYKNFKLFREEVIKINENENTIIATGPLTSDKLTKNIQKLINSEEDLYFYDAVAPIIDFSSIDLSKVFWGSRYDKGTKDAYLNIPFSKEEYEVFYDSLINAETVILKDFEKDEIFESCIPIEVLAKRGKESMRFGPLKPVGLYNNGQKYYAVLQLRREDKDGKMFNMVGFQTNLTFKEQKRIFSTLNGLENVKFYRYGIMHRNTYLNSPKFLNSYMQMKKNENIFFAGQITGVEGYVESIMSGLISGINIARQIEKKEKFIAPRNTITGALQRYISEESLNRKKFEPMNANFGILENLNEKNKNKKDRKKAYFERGIQEMKKAIKDMEV